MVGAHAQEKVQRVLIYKISSCFVFARVLAFVRRHVNSDKFCIFTHHNPRICIYLTLQPRVSMCTAFVLSSANALVFKAAESPRSIDTHRQLGVDKFSNKKKTTRGVNY